MSRRTVMPVVLLALTLFLPAVARADFGLVPGQTTARATERDGTAAGQAGSHPYALTMRFQLKTDATGHSEGGEIRDFQFDLPPGLIGNPQAVPACPRQSFEGSLPTCSPDTQIGIARAIAPITGQVVAPIYNLVAPPGVAAQVGSAAVGLTFLGAASVQTDEGYGLRIDVSNLPIEVTGLTVTIWGTPADPGHDPERGPGPEVEGVPSVGGHSSHAPLLPFLTLPASCGAPPKLTVSVDSKLAPGVFSTETVGLTDAGGGEVTLTGCEAVPFSPTIQTALTTPSADSPTGLGFNLKLPNQGLLNPREGSVAETEPVRTEVALPTGITANPAAVNGQGVCTLGQFRAASATVQGCPDASKLGTLTATSPLLEEAIEGSVYLAAPRENPFGTLLALYIVARAPQRGVVVKQAGRIDANPVTGQLTTTIDGLPPIPYSGFEVQLREGPRAPLISPQFCGTYTPTARLYSFSAPGTAVERTAPFTITSGAGGSPCAASEAALPNSPGLLAGTTAPLAGSYSPFVFRLSRADGTQRFGGLEATLPGGLTGRLAGIPYCPEAAIAAAAARTNEGEGALELASPSCPSASRIGTVIAGAGAGPNPYFVSGSAYLAGPYKGAPLSMVIVTPAIAGPFDLGVVAVRAALYVDPETAKITVRSDPLPRILHGIPLDLRQVSVLIDREDFIINPTSCAQKQIGGALTSLAGATAPLTQRFQVGGCQGLAFKPQLKLSLKGPTKRSGHPALKAVVTYPKQGSYANIARAQVGLPHSEFLDQSNLNKVCKQAELRSNSCPAKSIYGHAKAWTPLLDKPLEGPVYLAVGFGYKLPALVADLNGQVRILLKGKVDTTKHGGIRNTFEAVPDAPVSRFVLEMKGGGKYGLLENSENLCRKPQRASALFTAQSGKTLHVQPMIGNGCKQHKAKKSHKKGS